MGEVRRVVLPVLGDSLLHDMSAQNPVLLIRLHRGGAYPRNPWERGDGKEKDRKEKRDLGSPRRRMCSVRTVRHKAERKKLERGATR